MNVSIVYMGVRAHPDVVVEVSALADGKAIVAELDRGAIDHLVGPAIGDRDAMFAALNRHRDAIRRAIEVYVFARAPLDGHLTLSWKDLRPFCAYQPAAA